MVDWADLIFVLNWKLFQTAHILMKGSEKRTAHLSRAKKKKGVGVERDRQTEKASDSTHHSLHQRNSFHPNQPQAALAMSTFRPVRSRASNGMRIVWTHVCACVDGMKEVCTTLAHFSSFHTIHKCTPTCTIKPLRTANWRGLKVDTAAGSTPRPSSHFHSLLFGCTTRCKQRHRVMTTTVYFSFFLGRMLLVWPHLRLRQLVARWCRRA